MVTESMGEVASVTSGFWVGTGSRDEPIELAGASHFLEHLLFKGTATRTARSIAESIDGVGGDMNAFTTKEYTAFYVRALAESMELALDVLCDIMWSPALRPHEVDSERQVILEEILMHADEPADVAHERLMQVLFAGHGLGREVLGEQASVEAMTTDDIRGFFDVHYRPENMVFAAAGRLDHDQVVKALEARFAGPVGGRPPGRSAPRPVAPTTVVDHRPSEQVHMVLGSPAPGRHDPGRYALAVVNHVLGGGLSSRLFQEVREKRGLAYSVYSEWESHDDAGAMVVYAGTSPENTRQVLDLVNIEMDRLASSGITDRELEVARGNLRAEMLLSLEDSGARMSRIGRSQLLHREVIAADELCRRIERVSKPEVDAMAAQVLGAERTLSVVGPVTQSDLVPVTGTS